MTQNPPTEEDHVTPEEVAIEGQLPLTAIDIESQKDMTPPRGHVLRNLHKWFAARPTPASRLAVLGSILPGETSSDDLLKLMQIGPKELTEGRAEYLEKKFSQKKSSGTIDDHYGYPNPNTVSPTQTEIDDLHETVRESWGGSLPTILDPTAGRGIIPFESMRYGLPTRANELNPVPSVIMKVALEFVPNVGSVTPEIYEWRDEIHQQAKDNISQYYPTQEPGREILNSAMTYLIRCDSCGGDIPLVVKWWLNKTSNGGDAIHPKYDNGEVEYEYVKVQNTDTDFDPNDGPVSRGDAECPHCGVVASTEEIRTKIREDDFKYSIYGVNYESPAGERKFRAGSEVDQKGLELARERVGSDFKMMDFLAEPIPSGQKTDEMRNYGMEEWRDILTPRQMVVHYEYLAAYREVVPEIQSEYSDQKAKAILTLLSLASSRALSFNSRLSQWFDARGYTDKIFTENNFALKKMSGDNNLSAPRGSYIRRTDQVIDSYEELVGYIDKPGPTEVRNGDAADMAQDWSPGSVDVAVVDPPYYSSIMYGELSDVFYVIQKEYLGKIYPGLFDSKLTNKDDEAVANPARFRELTSGEKSQKELSDEYYEEKMQEIFTEVHTLLSSGGVMTVMFTHREMDAWDTLTTALIKSGFTITATHPVKTEMKDRVGMQGKASADSSILLVARKEGTASSERTLWEDVQDDIRQAARKRAEQILDSGYNISKTDTAIAAYGPTLQKYAESYPVVNKKGEEIRPREALSEAREAVTGVLAERFLKTEGLDQIDSLTRWYILSWLIYENDTIPYDEARQLGVAANVDIDSIKSSTKIWGKSKKDIVLKNHEGRVQDIVLLKSDSADNPSSRKYPVDPTDTRFTYTIDSVHAAMHVYDREGPRAAWEWISDRDLKSNEDLKATVTALLEVLPGDSEMREILVNLVSGETGDYLDINLDHIDMSGEERQTELGDHQ